jgi:hypothetical protein
MGRTLKNLTHCRRGHELTDSTRGLANSCLICRAESQKAWKLRNPGRMAELKKEWREKHKDHERAYQKEYRRKHPECHKLHRLGLTYQQATKSLINILHLTTKLERSIECKKHSPQPEN